MRLKRIILHRFFPAFSLICLICSGINAQVPDPGLMGTHTVIKAEYNLGDLSYTPPPAALFPSNMEEIGSVHYPADLSNGPYPVLLFLHGRHSTCYDLTTLDASSAWPCPAGTAPITSYEGYDYLANTMASHGYIVISISANAINAIDGSLPAADQEGMDARGVLVQHHLDLWNGWNTTDTTGPFGSLFVGRLNMQNIGTMGHSRGGEGVIFNANYNDSLGRPYGIHAVLTLAPVDFYRHVMYGIPLLDVSPYCDGDVNDLEGVHFYDDARYSDTADAAPKHTVLFMGADHDLFNTVWTPGSYIAGGADDWLYSYPDNAPWCGAGAVGTGRFDTTVQKAALNAYLSAFYRVYIGHENQFIPILFTDSIAPPASSLLDTGQVYVSFHASKYNRLDINRTESTTRLTTNNLTGAVTESGLVASQICGNSLTEPDCGVTTNAAQKPHNGSSGSLGVSQMGMEWNAATQFYENAVPQADENLSGYTDLTFRAAVNFASVTTGPNLNFTVQLIDSLGDSASQVVGNFTNALFHQPGTQSGDLPKLMLNSIKIPLSGFTGVNMTKIRKVKFLFNKSATGYIFISDLAFTNPACGTFTPAYTDSITHNTYKVTFTNTSIAGNGDSLRYSWNFGQPGSGVLDTSTLTNPVHNYSAAGTYTACLTVTSYQKNDFICVDSICKTIVIPGRTAVPELNLSNITINPNPASGYLIINGAEKTDVLTLINLYGQVVFTTSITQTMIHLPETLPTGVYSAVITTDKGRVYKKLLIEH